MADYPINNVQELRAAYKLEEDKTKYATKEEQESARKYKEIERLVLFGRQNTKRGMLQLLKHMYKEDRFDHYKQQGIKFAKLKSRIPKYDLENETKDKIYSLAKRIRKEDSDFSHLVEQEYKELIAPIVPRHGDANEMGDYDTLIEQYKKIKKTMREKIKSSPLELEIEKELEIRKTNQEKVYDFFMRSKWPQWPAKVISKSMPPPGYHDHVTSSDIGFAYYCTFPESLAKNATYAMNKDFNTITNWSAGLTVIPLLIMGGTYLIYNTLPGGLIASGLNYVGLENIATYTVLGIAAGKAGMCAAKNIAAIGFKKYIPDPTAMVSGDPFGMIANGWAFGHRAMIGIYEWWTEHKYDSNTSSFIPDVIKNPARKFMKKTKDTYNKGIELTQTMLGLENVQANKNEDKIIPVPAVKISQGLINYM